MQQCSLNTGGGRWILLAAIMASGAAFVMGTAVPIGLPDLQARFDVSLSSLQWVVNAHLLSLGALILVGGALGDRYGRRRIFIAGLGLFSLAALLSGFVPAVEVLIAIQAVQGIGSAMMVPQSLAIINDCFVESERGRAIGLWAGISGGVAALGPLLGGWLVDAFSWRAIYFMVVPVGLGALAVAWLFVPRIPGRLQGRLDWLGPALVFLGLLGIAWGLISGPERGWDSELILVSLVGGAAGIGLFILTELRLARPMVHLEIFRNPRVAGANMATLFLYFGLNGMIFFTALNLQQVQGYSPSLAGLGLLPPILIITLFAGAAGALTDRAGPRLPMVAGPFIVAAGMALLAAAGPEASYWRDFLPGLTLFGAGMAMVIPALTKSALSVWPEFSGSASGINNGIARIAGLLAIAVLGAVALAAFSASLADAVRQAGLEPAQQLQVLEQAEKLGGIVIPDGFGEQARAAASYAVRSSFVYAFRWVLGICAGLAVASGLVAAATVR